MRKLQMACIAFLLCACGETSSPPGEQAPDQDSGFVAARQDTTSQSVSESERLNQWFDARFEERLQMSPAWLTQLARKERYDEYDDLSDAQAVRQLEWLAETVAQMQEQFSYELLDLETQTSWDLWIYQYERGREAQRHRRSRYIFTQMLGPQSSLAQFLIRFHKVDDASDMEAYARRIGGISNGIRELLSQARTNAQSGVRPPRFAYEGAIVEAEKLLSGAPFTRVGADSPLWSDAREKITALQKAEKIDAATADSLQENVREALLADFEPAYTELISWLNSDLDNTSTTAQGVHKLPNGDAYYEHRLRASTTTDLSADEIHEIGLAEVARIREEMEVIRRKVGFEGDLQTFFGYLKEDPQFQYPNTDEGREGYLRDSERYLVFINERLPEYFGILPKADLMVRRVESFREQDGAPQHYSRGSPDGSRPGVYYAHLSDMAAMPKHLMEAIAYHEGNPGHHMQISIAQESTSVATFRTQLGFTAFSEGWGLYAELLAREMGAYQNDYSDFGRLSTEIWRAIRLVVDTGIHHKGWSEEAAIAYFKENSALADGAIRAEVRRYFAWPGQATAYKIGMLKILELREYARMTLGDRFDIREFHDTVLSGGALPLAILEQRIRNWVARKS